MPLNQYSAMEIGCNEDLSTEILLRSPLKSVLKFKLVSKQWLSTVSAPRFLRLHTSRRGANPSPIGLWFKFFNYHSACEEFYYVSLKSDNNHHHVSSFDYITKGTSRKLHYLSSCNGFILFQCYDYDDPTYKEEYYVTNPTTKEFKFIPIPVPPIMLRKSQYVREYLAFDPSQSPHYKVVMVSFVDNTNNENRDKLKIDVYSEICSPPERNSSSFDLDCSTPPTEAMEGIFCNGILHMLSLEWTAMLCFDLNQQYLIKCPVPPSSGRVLYSIKQSGGIIYLLVRVESSIDVYELKMDYSGWVLKCHLDLTSLAIDFQLIEPNFPSPDRCMAMMSESIPLSILCEEEEGPTMVFTAFNQLVAYNLTRKTTKIIGNVHLLFHRGFCPLSGVFPRIETLAHV